MTKKSRLGQFYTTNYEYILQTFDIPENIPIIEPFAGNGDLLKFLKTPERLVECYDIDPKQPYIVQRDSLLQPPSFQGKFVLTNPPYLAKNKCENKDIFRLYASDDLYKCFIELLTRDICEGGIIIVPLNFISSGRANDVNLRKQFIHAYTIQKINIFEEQVFNDTAYTVCSMQFIKKQASHAPTICTIYPSRKNITFQLDATNHYTIGGDIYSLPQSAIYTIERATKDTKTLDCITNIVSKCIDDSIHSKIQLRIATDIEADRYIDRTPNLSERSYATLVISPKLSMQQQHALVEQVNHILDEYRERYNSLFLSNFRESNSIARKRISFGLVFRLCSYTLRNQCG